MTAEDYKRSFTKDGKLDSTEFLKAFAIEFNEKLSIVNTYYEFNDLVANMQDKFLQIRGQVVSEKSMKRHIKDKLWKAFFAIYVVPRRTEMFPKEQTRLENKRKRYEEIQDIKNRFTNSN